VSTSLPQEQPTDITDLSASALSIAIREGRVSCVEVMQAYLERVHRLNPIYNAIVSLRDDGQLLDLAEEADTALARGEYRGWMHGLPHAVKDLADVKGLPTSRGSPIFAGKIAREDSLHVARMRAAGAIFIGKTNTSELGVGSQTYNSVFGATRNAYDTALTAGGSSGGAAVALATQMLATADGTDFMGSLRNPAAFNNVIGFRPSPGRVPSLSDDLFYLPLSTDGPLGRTVEDTIRLLLTLSGYDARVPLSLRDELPEYDDFSASDLDEIHIGWLGDYDGYLATEPGVLERCERGLGLLLDRGAIVDSLQPPFDMSALWEAWLTLRHFASLRYRELYDDENLRGQLKPEIVWEIEGGLDLDVSRLAAAATVRTDWYRAVRALFDRHSLLALPSAQTFAFAVDTHWPNEIAGRRMDTYHRWMEVVIGATLAGLPVISLPAGFDERGRAMGMQFIGPPGHDRAVLEFALRYAQITDYLDRRPAIESTP
jgi:amidase